MIKSQARRMKAVAVVAVGFLLAGVSAGAASATPQGTSGDTPQCVPRDAVEYQPAVDPTYETIPNPNYVPAVAEIPEVSHTEWKYSEHGGSGKVYVDNNTYKYVDDNGVGYNDKDDIPEGTVFYERTEHTRTHVTQERVPGSPAIGEPTIQNMTDPGSPEVPAVEAVYCQIGLYVYPKLNSGAPAGWTNSGPQTFIASKNGVAPTDWYTSIGQLPAEVCGTGWGYQQDATKSATPVDFSSAVVEYPNFTVGWPPIYDDKHGELSDLVEVPDCEPVDMEVTPAAVTVDPTCGPNNDVLTIPTTEGVTYTDTGWVNNERTITATAKEGYVLAEGAQTSWTFTDDATPCPIDVNPVAASVVDPPVCGPNNDVLNIPTTEGVTYTDTGWVNNERTITATAQEGYTLVGTALWTFTDVPTAGCPDEPPVFSYTPPNELAFTGPSSSTGGLVALAAFLVTSGTALLSRRFRA